MPRRLPTLAILALCLAACAQAPSDAMQANAAPAPAVVPTTTAPAATAEASMPNDHASTPASTPAPATRGGIEGAIRDGNRAPPALRVCAHPLDGGKPTCVDTAAGATAYRIELPAGRYVVAGMAKDDPGMQFAHAERIRCIRAPCPPDTAIAVEIAEGETKSGIDLTAGGVQQPEVEKPAG